MSGDWLRRLLADATPGHWEIDPTGLAISVRDQEWLKPLGIVRAAIIDCGYSESPHALGDARLIAKSPALAEWAAQARDALAMLTEYGPLEGTIRWNKMDTGERLALITARAVLARYEEIGGDE